ncbi:MAG: GDP-mannose 4,6-dehydratase, partial [Nanoarchaeota archaeon]|nr:GDP-mannose 4,6-dehydratase [Nanoarchaeota archaeon]
MAFEWSDRRVLVTGATGFLGSWLVKGLAGRKANVVGLIRKNTLSNEPALPRDIGDIDVVYGQLEDYFCVERCINEHDIDTVFHLGAQTIVETATK